MGIVNEILLGQGTGGGGIWTLVSSAAASSSASVDFVDDIDPSTNSQYRVVIDGMVPATNAASLTIKSSNDSGSTWNSTVGGVTYIKRASAPTNFEYTDGAFSVNGRVTADMRNTTGLPFFIVVDISFENDASAKGVYTTRGYFVFSDSDTNYTYISGGGILADENDTDSIQFIMSSGNINSGNFKLYKLSNS